MYVLGLNGWGPRSHDAASCLMLDGRIVAFAEEERFNRRKHAYDAFPHLSAAWCLSSEGLTLDDIDEVAFGWNVPTVIGRNSLPEDMLPRTLDEILPHSKFPRSKEPTLSFIDHHLAHGASAFYLSGQDQSTVIVIDGQGETASTTIFSADQTGLRKVLSFPIGWSLGYFYEAACEFVGFRTGDSGKLMGLAAHGRDEGILDNVFELGNAGLNIEKLKMSYQHPGEIDEQQHVLDGWRRVFSGATRQEPNLRRENALEWRNFAAAAQAQLERAVLSIVATAVRTTGIPDITIAGGVGYNATVNGKIRLEPKVRRLFVQPVAGDSGVALGAAAVVTSAAGIPIAPLDGDLRLGPFWPESEIQQVLNDVGVSYFAPEDLTEHVSERLGSGQLVGWFQGPAEVGPRALGARSLLASPRSRKMRDRINIEAKQRESWRPLAPSMTAEISGSILGAPLEFPYMIETTTLRESMREEFGAVVHEDGTTRPQTVSRSSNPLFHDLLLKMPDQAVLNTSFNGRDEPIVHTPVQALEAARHLKLDSLAIGSFVIELRDAK